MRMYRKLSDGGWVDGPRIEFATLEEAAAYAENSLDGLYTGDLLIQHRELLEPYKLIPQTGSKLVRQ